jgi:hypothetical protein
MQEELEGNSIRLVLPEGDPGAALQQMVEAELPGGTRLTSPATPLPPGCLPPR